MDKLRFLSLGSGSSGNSYFIGNSKKGIIIDAGVAPRSSRKALRSIGIDFPNIYGIFVTHDHFDHVKAIGTLSGNFNIPVYATEKVHARINLFFGEETLNGNRRFFKAGETVEVSDFKVTSFSVDHDASETVGFFIEYMDHKIMIATDVGKINDDIRKYLSLSDIVIIEANYDKKLLEDGNYPFYLKDRITSGFGHLCNEETGKVLAENWHKELHYIFFCHLSNNNNFPGVAMDTIYEILDKYDIDYSKIVMRPLMRRIDKVVYLDK